MIYAGVQCIIPTADLVQNIQDTITQTDIHGRVWQEDPTLMGWPIPVWPRSRPVRPGTLYWPSGASRWAEAYLLASSAQLALITQAVYQGGSQATPQPLTVTDGEDSVTAARMWMLPPRPLTGSPYSNQMWLLPLVDDRYWWMLDDTVNLVVTAGESWSDLISLIEETTGPIEEDEIPSAYLSACPGFSAPYQPIPFLLDALAYSTGRRVLFAFDGTVSLVNAATVTAGVGEELFEVRSVSGGGSLVPVTVPGNVSVVFPGSTPLVVSSEALPGVLTYPFTRTIYSPLTYNPEDQTFFEDLGEQIAEDYYAFRALGHDIDFPGAADWEPDGVSDLEFTLLDEGCHTRVKTVAEDTITQLFMPDEETRQYVVIGVYADYLKCVPFTGFDTPIPDYSSTLGSAETPVVYVAKPYELQQTPFNGQTVTLNGQTVSYTYTGVGARTASGTISGSPVTEGQVIVPDYILGDVIDVVSSVTGLTDPNGDDITLADANSAGRAFAFVGPVAGQLVIGSSSVTGGISNGGLSVTSGVLSGFTAIGAKSY